MSKRYYLVEPHPKSGWTVTKYDPPHANAGKRLPVTDDCKQFVTVESALEWVEQNHPNYGTHLTLEANEAHKLWKQVRNHVERRSAEGTAATDSTPLQAG